MGDACQKTKIPTKQHHFVLVHGLCHGAWCWYKVRALLEKSGHKVTAVDLIGAGINQSDCDSLRTFVAYDEPLVDLLSSLPEGEKVILVGHSAGGLSLTHAVHAFPKKIELLVFVAATMLRSGFCGPQDFQDGVPSLTKHGDVFEAKFGLGHDKPPTSSKIKPSFLRKIFYQLSPAEDVALGSMLLRPGPALAVRTAKFEGEEELVDGVKRVYVKTAHDLVLKPEQQDALIKRWPPSQVYTLDSDHCPFFSTPTEFFGVLIQAAASI